MQTRSEQRWMSLWRRLCAQGDGLKVYNDLVTRYSEPHRAYHILGHIEHCLDELELALRFVINLEAIELALWYHDAIYDTRARDNEGRSAALAIRMMADASILDVYGPSVTNLIMATRHLTTPTDPDAQLLVDIDLSILGQPGDKFDEYERQIRKEYEWVKQEEFASRRIDILMSLLNRPKIYSTKFFQEKYELQAGRNLTRSIAKLLR